MTESFGSAQGFLASARTEAPSRVLELQVPGLSGLDRQKRMTEAGVETHRFPYGPRQYTSLSEGNEARAIEFLLKPFSDTAFAASVDIALRTS